MVEGFGKVLQQGNITTMTQPVMMKNVEEKNSWSDEENNGEIKEKPWFSPDAYGNST